MLDFDRQKGPFGLGDSDTLTENVKDNASNFTDEDFENRKYSSLATSDEKIFEHTSPFFGLNTDELTEIMPETEQRSISAKPWKILDAPGLQDDFYMNVLDWSQ